MTPDEYDALRSPFIGDWHPTYPWTVVTLRDHIYCRHEISLSCPPCRRFHLTFDLFGEAERRGAEFPLHDALAPLRCRDCGRKFEVSVTWCSTATLDAASAAKARRDRPALAQPPSPEPLPPLPMRRAPWLDLETDERDHLQIERADWRRWESILAAENAPDFEPPPRRTSWAHLSPAVRRFLSHDPTKKKRPKRELGFGGED